MSAHGFDKIIAQQEKTTRLFELHFHNQDIVQSYSKLLQWKACIFDLYLI